MRTGSHAILAGAEVSAEEWQDEILDPDRHRAGVGPGIDFERIGDSITVENLVESGRAGA
jgi:hypothetical protein